MVHLDWLVGFAIAAAGYCARLLQDWLAWRRSDIRDDQHRWKLARMDVLRELSICASDLIAVARGAGPVRHDAWTDPTFTESVSAHVKQWQGLKLQARLLVAHRDTMLDVTQLEGALFATLPPRSATEPWDVDALTKTAERRLSTLIQLSRTNELGLLPIGIPAGPAEFGPVRRWLYRQRARGWERRRG